MSTVTLRPNSTIVAPTSVTGAASAHLALSDSNSSTYVGLDGDAVCGLESFSQAGLTFPAGAVTK